MTPTAIVLNVDTGSAPHHHFTTFHGFCLLAGQALMCISSFFWNSDGRYSIDGSVVVILSMVFWAAGLQDVYALFSEKNSWFARLGLLYAMYAALVESGSGSKVYIAPYSRLEAKLALLLMRNFLCR